MDLGELVFLNGSARLTLAAVVMASIAACSEGPDQTELTYPIQSFEDYKALLDKAPSLLDSPIAATTKGVMERSMRAHHAMDTDAAVAELSEDYAWMHVFQGTATTAVSGREIAREITYNVYEGSDYLHDYLGSDSRPIAIVGNLGIQLEIENFKNEDGSLRASKSVSIYEIKDGKLWRIWAFVPAEN